MEKKTMIMNEYLQYRFEDLEVENKSQEMKANNTVLSPAVRVDALTRIEVIGFILEMFMYAVQQGHNVSGMTVETVIEIATGKKIADFHHNGIAKAYHTVDGAVGKAVDITVDGLRIGMNKLGEKLVKWSAKK